MVRFVVRITPDLVERANENMIAHRANSDAQLQAVIDSLPSNVFSEEKINKAFADALRDTSTQQAIAA